MAGFSIRGGDAMKALALKLQTRSGKLHMKTALTMERVTVKVERDVKRELTGSARSNAFWGKGGASGDQLAVRSGQARNTIARRVFTRVLTVVGVVGSPLGYVAMHERGGTVHGKPWLRIPTGYAKTPAGVDRYLGMSARSIPNTRIFRSKAGNLFVWEVGTERAKASPHGVVPLYLLKPSVTLRARHMFKRTLAKDMSYIHEQFLRASATLVGA